MTVSAILRRIRESGAHHAGGGVVPRQTDADYILTHGTNDEKAKYRRKVGESRYKLDDGNQLVLRPVTEIATLLGSTGGYDDGNDDNDSDDNGDKENGGDDDGDDENRGDDDDGPIAAPAVTDASKDRKRVAFAEGNKGGPKDVKRARGNGKIPGALRDEIKNMFADGSDEDDESDEQPEWQKEGYAVFGAINDDPKPQRLVVGLLGEDRVIRAKPINVDCNGFPVIPTMEHMDVWPSNDEKQLSTSLGLENYVKVAGQSVGATKEQSWDNVCEKLFQARKKVDGTTFKYWTTWDDFLRRPRLAVVIRAAENAGKTFATPYDYESLDDKTRAVHEMVATADRAQDAVKSLYANVKGAFGELKEAFDDGNVDEQMLKRQPNAITAIAVKGAYELIGELAVARIDNAEFYPSLDGA